MKFTLIVSAYLLTARASVDITVTETEGGQAIITCSYPAGYKQSKKYFYKGPYKEKNIIFESNGEQSSLFKDRFSLNDNHQTSFTVTIRDLKMTDTGLYACAAGWGISESIQLNVLRAPQKPKPIRISTSTIRPKTNTSTETLRAESVTPTTSTENTTFPHDQQITMSQTDLASIAGGLGSVLLVLVLCSGIFLILKKKERNCETELPLQNLPQNTKTDCMYEEILSNDVIAAASLTNQMSASDLNARVEVTTIYAAVTSQQPDSVTGHTLSTNQETDRDCDYYGTLRSSPSTPHNRTETIYVTATLPQSLSKNEGPIYSEITHY